MEAERNDTFRVSKRALQMGQMIVLSKQLNAFGISKMLNWNEQSLLQCTYTEDEQGMFYPFTKQMNEVFTISPDALD